MGQGDARRIWVWLMVSAFSGQLWFADHCPNHLPVCLDFWAQEVACDGGWLDRVHLPQETLSREDSSCLVMLWGVEPDEPRDRQRQSLDGSTGDP